MTATPVTMTAAPARQPPRERLAQESDADRERNDRIDVRIGRGERRRDVAHQPEKRAEAHDASEDDEIGERAERDGVRRSRDGAGSCVRSAAATSTAPAASICIALICTRSLPGKRRCRIEPNAHAIDAATPTIGGPRRKILAAARRVQIEHAREPDGEARRRRRATDARARRRTRRWPSTAARARRRASRFRSEDTARSTKTCRSQNARRIVPVNAAGPHSRARGSETPRKRHQPQSSVPAQRKRSPAIHHGGIDATASRMAGAVEPHRT